LSPSIPGCVRIKRMEKWIGDLLIDASPPEKPKFKSPMILVHGLWSGSWSWRSWATHFSNLGWECWAVNFRGRFEERSYPILRHLTFQDCVEDMKKVIRSAAFPPLLVAHDLGGLVAQKAAEGEKLAALVLLSSLPSGDIRMALPRSLRRWRSWRIAKRDPSAGPPSGRGSPWL